MAMVAAVASAVAAWKAHATANESFKFNKTILKYQDEIFILRAARADLVQLKRILECDPSLSDEEFSSIEDLKNKIKTNLDVFLKPNSSAPIDLRAVSNNRSTTIDDINWDIKTINARIGEIFS